VLSNPLVHSLPTDAAELRPIGHRLLLSADFDLDHLATQ
jgi:hypothetical protein